MGHLYGCVVTTLLGLNRLICLCQSQVYNTWRILPSLSFSNYTLLLPWGGGGGDIFFNYVLLIQLLCLCIADVYISIVL